METEELFTYDWCIQDDDKMSAVTGKDICEGINELLGEEKYSQTKIRIYCLDSENKTVCVNVEDFYPYVYLELPEEINWNQTYAQMLGDKLDTLISNPDERPVKKSLVKRKKLYYTNIDKKTGKRKYFHFLLCTFRHVKDMMNLRKRIYRPVFVSGLGNISLKIHEDNVEPILQLTSFQKLPTAGWIQIKGKKVEKERQITYCDREYNVYWRNISPIVSNKVARPYIMSIDLEVYSSVPSAMPKAKNEKDKIFQCSCVCGRQGDKEDKYEKYILTLGKLDRNTLPDDIIPREYKTERSLFLGLRKLILEKNPNLIIGYNIFTFDIPYLVDRAEGVANCAEFKEIGFLRDIYGIREEISWSSSAYKNQNYSFLAIEGRLFVDMLPIVKRDNKLSNYSLKTVASHFLSGVTKDPLDAKGIFRCYLLGMTGTDKGKRALSLCAKYCVKDSLLVIKLFEVLTTWFALCEMSNVCNVPIFKLYTQGQQLKVFSQVHKKCIHEGYVVEKNGYIAKENEHYVGATVVNPVAGVYDMVLPFDFASLYPTTIIAYNISWDTLVNDDDIPDKLCHVMEWEDHVGCSHDPKVVRKTELTNKIKELDLEGKNLGKKSKLNAMKKDELKERLKPLRRERQNINKSKPKHIICGKFKYRWLKAPMGILPEILTHLLDARSATKKEMKAIKKQLEEMKKGNKGVEVKEGKGEEKGKKGEKEKGNKGGEKKENKTDEKKELEYYELSIYYDVLDQRQLSLKVSANSAYGALGVRRGRLPFMPGAMCTTYMGRKSIEKASKAIQTDFGGKLVYGDTDSNYVNFPHLKTSQECWDHAVMVAKKVSDLFPKPMSLAFEEKLYFRFFILTKKRYMCLSCNREGEKDSKINKKGVLLTRRDNCNFIRQVYAEVIMMVFEKKETDDIIYYIIQQINKLFSSSFPSDQFVVTKSVGEIGELIPKECYDEEGNILGYKIGDYKIRTILSDDKKTKEKQLEKKKCESDEDYYLKCLPAQAQLAEKLRRRGQLVSAGSRLEYLVTTTGGVRAKQSEKIEDFEYFSRHNSSLKIDYLYYADQMVNSFDQILDIILSEHGKVKEHEFMKKHFKLRMTKYKLLEQLKSYFQPKFKITK